MKKNHFESRKEKRLHNKNIVYLNKILFIFVTLVLFCFILGVSGAFDGKGSDLNLSVSDNSTEEVGEVVEVE